MPFYKKLDEEDLLRLQRIRQQESTSATSNSVRSHASEMNADSVSSKKRPAQLTAFQSMSKLELEWITAWHDQFMRHQKNHLWKQFESLSVGQKRAVMLDAAKVDRKPIDKLAEPNWNEWSQKLQFISQLPLQDEETFKEKRAEDHGNETPFYMIKQSEMLSPYQEIMLWLCYKGNHQGKQELLQRLDQLSIEAKKLLILKILGNRKCNCANFSQELTIVEHQKTVVDWERILQHVQTIDQLSSDDLTNELLTLEQSSISEMGPPNNLTHSIDSEEEMASESTSHTFSEETSDSDLRVQEHIEDEEEFVVATLNERRLSLLNHFTSIDDLQLLLLGGSAKMNTPRNLKQKDFIDQCLNIPISWSAKKREKIREKKLKQLQFTSLHQLFIYLIEQLVERLYHHGVLKREASYVQLFKSLALMNGDNMPTQDQISQKLFARIEQ